MKVLFFASGAFAIPAFDALRKSAHSIVGVVSQPDRPAGRGRSLTSTPLAAHAAAAGFDVKKIQNANSPEFIDFAATIHADVIAAIAFGQKLSDELLASATCGGINLHGSLLPAFRGAAPVNAAILSGRKTTGVTVIRLTNVMDGGDILASRETEIGDTQTAGELHDQLAVLGGGLVPMVLDRFESGDFSGRPQQLELVSKAPKLSKAMAWVDFTAPAEAVSARIRGLSPWPGCQVHFVSPDGTRRISAQLLRCRAEQSGAGPAGTVLHNLQVGCGQGTIQLMDIVPQGRKQMDVKAFANGYGLKPGWQVKSGAADTLSAVQ